MFDDDPPDNDPALEPDEDTEEDVVNPGPLRRFLVRRIISGTYAAPVHTFELVFAHTYQLSVDGSAVIFATHHAVPGGVLVVNKRALRGWDDIEDLGTVPEPAKGVH